MGRRRLGADLRCVSKANGESDGCELRVEGRAAARASVTASETGSSIALRTTTANSEGKWPVRVSNPSQMPCHVRGSAGGTSAEHDVPDRRERGDLSTAPIDPPACCLGNPNGAANDAAAKITLRQEYRDPLRATRRTTS